MKNLLLTIVLVMTSFFLAKSVFADTLYFDSTFAGGQSQNPSSNEGSWGQSFVASSTNIYSWSFTANATFNRHIEYQLRSGSISGTVLATATGTANVVSGDDMKLTFPSPVTISTGTTYFISTNWINDGYGSGSYTLRLNNWGNDNYSGGTGIHAGSAYTVEDFSFKYYISVPVCGDSLINSPEICDSNNTSCTLGIYSGTKQCNATCDGWQDCIIPPTYVYGYNANNSAYNQIIASTTYSYSTTSSSTLISSQTIYFLPLSGYLLIVSSLYFFAIMLLTVFILKG